MPAISLIMQTACCMSPTQNEHLTLSVLALRAFCWSSSTSATSVECEKLIGVLVDDCPFVELPVMKTFCPIKLEHHTVTTKNVISFENNKSYCAFINAERASSFDGIVTCDPWICTQDKQSVLSRRLVAGNKKPESKDWRELSQEITKCQVKGPNGKESILIIVTDYLVTHKPDKLPSRVVLFDHTNLPLFFGDFLARRRASALAMLLAPTRLTLVCPTMVHQRIRTQYPSIEQTFYLISHLINQLVNQAAHLCVLVRWR